MSVALKRSRLAALVLLASALSALGAETAKVQISKLAFLPAEITVHVGDTVEWSNGDFIPHTATVKPAAGSAGWDVPIPAGKTAQLLITEAGTVDYLCRFHPNMKAKIIVLAK